MNVGNEISALHRNVLLDGQKITKRFGGLVALSEVDFTVREGEILGLIGPNGAGKTTLVNIISGIYKPDSGKILFRGIDISGMRPDKICKLGMGRTFQVVQSFPELTLLQNTLVGSIFGNKERAKDMSQVEDRAEKLLDAVGLEGRSGITAKNLTVMELKKLDLARALATNPIILILDEINTGLNPTESQEAVSLIRRIRGEGKAILIVEHLMRIIMSVCDRIVVLDHGKKIAEGSPSEIASDEAVVKAYLGKEFSQR